MNRIILIGNGLDLAHRLPTSYKDFINWYFCQWLKRLIIYTGKNISDDLCSFSLIKDVSWCAYLNARISTINPPSGLEFIEFLKEQKEDNIVRFTPFMESICKSIETKGWVDIENEYYGLLKTFLYTSSNKYESPKQLNTELNYLKQCLINYLQQVQGNFFSKEKNINPNIEKLVLEPIYVRDISCDGLSKKKEMENKFLGGYLIRIMVLNFNYTKTADVINNEKVLPEIITNHIHGDLSDPKRIIFGYGDELDEDFKALLKLNENEFLAEIKSVRYLETDRYRKLLEFIESDLYQVYIMGHSCGNSDRTLLNTLFEHKNCVSIKPFYYKDESGSDNYLDIVQNIMRNFTDMKMMRDRVVNKEYSQPLPQITNKI